MNVGAGFAAATGGIVGLFVGAIAGQAFGGSENEMALAGLGGAALGAFTGAVLVSPDAPATSTSVGTGAPPDEDCAPCNAAAVFRQLNAQLNPQIG
jgi:hypothetical protein